MSTPKPNIPTGSFCTFNVQHGFAEALLRGMRSSFLSDPDYHHLTQCETLDDVRLNLTETDYADVLADSSTLTPNSLQKAAVEKVCLSYRGLPDCETCPTMILEHVAYVDFVPCPRVPTATPIQVLYGCDLSINSSNFSFDLPSLLPSSSTCVLKLSSPCRLSLTLSHMST